MPRAKRITYEVDDAVITDNVNEKWPEINRKFFSEFATTLNKLLIDKQIDQEKMASDLNISTGSISLYRNGKGNPTLDKIRLIADYLEVDCNYLLTGVKAEHQSIASYTGLTEQTISQLHYYKERSDKEKKGSWLSIESKVLQAANTLIEKNFSILLYIADYLYFRRYNDFGITADPKSYPDANYEEFKDTDVDINGEYVFENQTVPASMVFNINEVSDVLLFKIQSNLIKLREQIMKGDGE